MTDFTIDINMDKKCAECGKGGATQSEVCLSCAAKAIQGKKMKSRQGKILQSSFQAGWPRS